MKLSASMLTWVSVHIIFTLPSKSPNIRSNWSINFLGRMIPDMLITFTKSNSVLANLWPSVATHLKVDFVSLLTV